MPLSITLAEAKGFLRVADAAEDALVGLLIDAAETRVGAAIGSILSAASPPSVRLAVLLLVAHAYENRNGTEPSPGFVETWLAPHRTARL